MSHSSSTGPYSLTCACGLTLLSPLRKDEDRSISHTEHLGRVHVLREPGQVAARKRVAGTARSKGTTALDASKAHVLRMRRRLTPDGTPLSTPITKEQAKRIHPAFLPPSSTPQQEQNRPQEPHRAAPGPQTQGRHLQPLPTGYVASQAWEQVIKDALHAFQDGQPRIKHMAPTLITRLAGHRVVLSRVPTGLGPMVWAGEFRREDGQPYTSRDGSEHPLHEMRVAPDLGGLLRALERLAERVEDRPLTKGLSRAVLDA